MLRLHYSNRLEDLIEPLQASIATAQDADPLRAIPIIVPSRAVEHFLKFALAERLGVAANLTFPFLRSYLKQIAERADPRQRVLEAAHLQLLLFDCIRLPENQNDPELKAVRNYIGAASGDDPNLAELKCFQLAGQVARLFQEYSISRSAMVHNWHARAFASDPEFIRTERWQRRLWNLLFDSQGAAKSSLARDGDNRWRLLPAALAQVDDAALLASLPEELHVFAIASPGQAFAEIFARLGRLIDLSVYAFNPCREFWEDLDTSRRAEFNGWARRNDRAGAALENSEDPFGLSADDNQSLQLWGRPGREYVRLLNEISDCDFDARFSARPDGNSLSLLDRLKLDILERAPEGRGHAQRSGDAAADESIRILACPTIRREAEIVASEIWALLERRSRIGAPIRFHEIAILIPDAAYAGYRPHIEAVFESMHSIPVEFVGRAAMGPTRVAEAIGLLLELPLSRFTRDDLLRIARHPATRGSDPDLDTERFSRWCDELGVFLGADADDLADTYIPPHLFNWDQALKRVALGVFMSSERDEPNPFFALADGGRLLGLELSESDAPAATLLVAQVRALLADALAIRSARMTLPEWSRILALMVDRYIDVSDPDDEQELERCRGAIDAVGAGGIDCGEVSYQVARESVAAALDEIGLRRTTLTGRGVAAGPMSAMHSLPFRAIFVMGLGEGIFPARAGREPLDLRQERRRAGDVSATDRDRYLFLESMLAARERVTLSYVARDSQTGDSLEPSTIIRELQFILRAYLDEPALEMLVVTHPASRYDLAYFPELRRATGKAGAEDSRLVSFDSAARTGARMSALRSDLEAHMARRIGAAGAELLARMPPAVRSQLETSLALAEPIPPHSRLSEDEDLRLPLSAIRHFLECPLQGAARHALGMQDDDESEPTIEEPLAQSILDRSIVLREIFWRSQVSEKAETAAYEQAIELAQMRGRSPTGPFADAARKRDIGQVASWSKLARSAAGNLAQWKVVRIGHAENSNPSDIVLPPLRLHVPIPDSPAGNQFKTVSLHGSLGYLAPGLDIGCRCIVRTVPAARDFLELYLNAIVLSAADVFDAPSFHAIVIGTEGKDRKSPLWHKDFVPPSPDAARAYLAAIVVEILWQSHDYFFPIEAAQAVHKEMSKAENERDLTWTVESIASSPYAHCQSDYGPIPNARSYAPPSEDRMREILKLRFAPIEAVLEPSKDKS